MKVYIKCSLFYHNFAVFFVQGNTFEPFNYCCFVYFSSLHIVIERTQIKQYKLGPIHSEDNISVQLVTSTRKLGIVAKPSLLSSRDALYYKWINTEINVY